MTGHYWTFPDRRLPDRRRGYFTFRFAFLRSAQYFFIRADTAFRAAADIFRPRFRTF